jgi:hypothetical protein
MPFTYIQVIPEKTKYHKWTKILFGEKAFISNDYCLMHHLPKLQCTFSPDHLMGVILSIERGRLSLRWLKS